LDPFRVSVGDAKISASVEAFVASATVRQLRLLREIALGLEGGEEVATH
jgi:hypothetical protein